jgi:hypothetical protein
MFLSRAADVLEPLHLPAHTVNRVEHQRSRQLISDSRALNAFAKALSDQSRQSMARQSSVRIVCAWCHQTIRWLRTEEAARGFITQSICLPCCADVVQELDPANALPPVPTKGRKQRHSHHTCASFRQHPL